MKWSITSKDYHYLRNTVSMALSKAFRDTSRPEPQLVANLVWHLPNQINSVRFSNGFSVKSGGVFVHAQPFVRCKDFPALSPKSVELGDILLLRTGIEGGVVVDRRALLLQAKKYDQLPAIPDNKNQYHLYGQWPIFEYVRATKALNGKKRHIRGPDLYSAAKYLLIGQYPGCCYFPLCDWHHYKDLRHYCQCALTAQPSQPELSHYICFLYEMVEFILGNSGKSYLSPPPKWTKNWDRVIHDLLETTAERHSVYMKRASSGKSGMRGHTLAFLCGDFPEMSMLSLNRTKSEDQLVAKDGPPDVPKNWPQDDNGGGGISIIEFVVESEGVNRG